MATRRCTQRQFLLLPCEETKQAVLYCLAEAAQEHDIDVLWLMACSNHLHYGIHDRNGNYPKFLRRFHQQVSKLINCHWGRWGSVFDDDPTSMVELADAEAMFQKMIYSLTNPVKDNLVHRAKHWPGATSLRYHLDNEQLVVKRPDGFFRQGDDANLPDVVTLDFKRPPPFAHLTQEAWASKIRKAVADHERAAHAKRLTDSADVMGIEAVLAQPWWGRPESDEPHRKIGPRVAAKNKWRRIEALQRNHDFLNAYAIALAAYRAGTPDVTFPAGTYKLHVEHGVSRRDAA